MWHRDGALALRRMNELVVAAASSLKLPAIRLQELFQLATPYRVYYTHQKAMFSAAAKTSRLMPFRVLRFPVLSL